MCLHQSFGGHFSISATYLELISSRPSDTPPSTNDMIAQNVLMMWDLPYCLLLVLRISFWKIILLFFYCKIVLRRRYWDQMPSLMCPTSLFLEQGRMSMG